VRVHDPDAIERRLRVVRVNEVLWMTGRQATLLPPPVEPESLFDELLPDFEPEPELESDFELEPESDDEVEPESEELDPPDSDDEDEDDEPLDESADFDESLEDAAPELAVCFEERLSVL
jgi:hypothetical protein